MCTWLVPHAARRRRAVLPAGWQAGSVNRRPLILIGDGYPNIGRRSQSNDYVAPGAAVHVAGAIEDGIARHGPSSGFALVPANRRRSSFGMMVENILLSHSA